MELESTMGGRCPQCTTQPSLTEADTEATRYVRCPLDGRECPCCDDCREECLASLGWRNDGVMIL